MPRAEWRFVQNEAGETAGNDGNIAHFSGDRRSAIIRETIQNSLDAAQDLEKPVTVTFERVTLRRQDFGADQLAAAFSACLESGFVGERDKPAFVDARKSLEKEAFDTLVIRDTNTTGASNLVADGSAISMWEALTKSSGINEKPGRSGKMGSWGLGKNASFATSRFRTALYATTFQQHGSSAGAGRRLFQGKAVLASHRYCDKLYNPNGYFGASGYEPLQGDDVPEMFRLDDLGTAIWIPGYAFAETWEDEARAAAIRSFFHAILRDKLRLKIGGSALNCENIRRFSCRDPKASRMLLAVSGEARAVKHFDRLGLCSVYVSKDVDGTTEGEKKHLTGLVRDAGMLLTDTRGRMGRIGQKLRIPRDWAPFAAVLHCDSQGKDSFLRDCENPSHDEIEHDHISDPGDKDRALKSFAELGLWARSVIEEVAAPDPSADQKNVTELSDMLPGTKPEGEDAAGAANQGTLPRPREHQSVPRARRRATGGPRKVIPPTPPDPPVPPNPPNPPNPPRPPRPPAPPRQYVREVFRRVRFQRASTDTHRVTVTFTADGDAYSAIQLVAVGEDNREDEVLLSHAAWDESEIPTTGGVIERLPRIPDSGERVRFVLRTREPIDDKCLALAYRRVKDR